MKENNEVRMPGTPAAVGASGATSPSSGTSASNSSRSSSGSNSGPRSGPRRRTPRPWWERKRKYPIPLTQQQTTMRTWGLRLLMILLAFICGPLVFWTPAGMRALPALAIAGFLFMMLKHSTRQGMVLSLIYLSFIGGLRRWLIPALGWADSDPMILVGPALVLLYFFNLLLTRRIHRDTRLSRLLLWLLLFMFVEIFNPIQGSIGVGLGGIIFCIVPLLWYYYGRDLADEAVLNAVLATCVGISVVAAAYGLYQTWFGFLPSETAWMKLNAASYNALSVAGNVVHAFSFFTSAQEYAQMMSLGVVILWAAFLRGTKAALLPIPILALALFLESIRSSVVFTVAACVVLWAVQGRSWAFWAPRLALAAVLAFFGMASGLNKVQENTYDDKTQALVTHQLKGLLSPNDKKSSTAGSHAAMLGYGIINGFKTPVGYGLGSTTIAGNKLGGQTLSTEIDISDNFVGLGFAGGLIYVAIVVTVLGMALRYWRATRNVTSLAVLGVLVISIGQWGHGSLYAVSMVCWICIGGLDRAVRRINAQEKTLLSAASEGQTGSLGRIEDAKIKAYG